MVDRFAFGSPVTALTAGPLTPGPVAAEQRLSGTPPIVDAQYAAAYAQYHQLSWSSWSSCQSLLQSHR